MVSHFYKGRLYIPLISTFAINHRSLHATPPLVIPVALKTWDLVKRQFTGLVSAGFTFDYVDVCAVCQANQELTHRPSVPLHPIPPLSDATPFSTVSMDFITELPKSDGFDAIAVFVNHDVTKAAVFCPLSLYYQQLTAWLPSIVITYGNISVSLVNSYRIVVPQFTAAFTRDLCSLLNIRSSPFYGLITRNLTVKTERVNQELEQYLRAYTSIRQNDWASHLSTAKFAHNIRTHSTTSQSRFTPSWAIIHGPFPLTSPGIFYPDVQNTPDLFIYASLGSSCRSNPCPPVMAHLIADAIGTEDEEVGHGLVGKGLSGKKIRAKRR